MKKLYTIGFVLMVLFSMTMSVGALEYKTIYRHNGMSAYADWVESTPEDLTTDTFLGVTKSNDGTDIYLSIYTYDTAGYWSYKYGYKFIKDDVFSIDKRLNSASLKAVQIYLYQWHCDEDGCWETPEGLVTVEATWTGTGDISKGGYKWMSKYDDYMAKGSDSSLSRSATAKGSINGDDLGTSNYGGLAKFKTAYMSMKK